MEGKVCGSHLIKAGVQKLEMSVSGAEDPLQTMIAGPALPVLQNEVYRFPVEYWTEFVCFTSQRLEQKRGQKQDCSTRFPNMHISTRV